jgi:hypothetical protein
VIFSLLTSFTPPRRIRKMPNPMDVLNRIKVAKGLTPDEEIMVKAAIEEAMSKVDDALRVVLVMIDEIEVRKAAQAQEKANAH